MAKLIDGRCPICGKKNCRPGICPERVELILNVDFTKPCIDNFKMFKGRLPEIAKTPQGATLDITIIDRDKILQITGILEKGFNITTGIKESELKPEPKPAPKEPRSNIYPPSLNIKTKTDEWPGYPRIQ